MSNIRAQIPDLHVEQLRPVGYSGDTFAMPARAEEDHSDQLVASLAGFSSRLDRMAANMAVDQRRTVDAERQNQENAIRLQTPEGRAEIRRTRKLPDGTPITDAQVLKMAGSTAGPGFADSVQEWASSRNLAGVDVEAEIRKMAAPTIEEAEGNRYVLGGFLPHLDNAISWAKDYQARQALEAKKQGQEQTTFSFLSSQVDAWAKPGAAPDSLKNGMQQLYSDIASGNSAVVDPDLLDQYRVQKAALVVDTNPQLAKTILETEIMGPDGKPRPQLVLQPRYASQVVTILERGEAATAKAEVAQGFSQRRQENFERVLQGGDYSAFRDLEIHGKKLTETEQKVQFVGDLSSSLDAQVAAGRMNSWQKTEEIARYTSRMNIDDPFIKGELEGIEARYSTVDAVNDPEYLKDIEGRAAAFNGYRASHRQSLKRQLSDKSFSWFEDFDLYKRYVDPSTEGAAEFANRTTNPPAGWDQGIGKYREKVATEVRSKLKGVFVSDSLAFSGAYEAQVTNLASKFVALGMSQSAAVDAATDKVFSSRVHYGGDPLFGLEKAGLPNDYQDVLARFAKDYKTLDARGKAYDGTPTFAVLDGGIMAMVDRDTGYFLEDQRGQLIAFDVQHVRDVSNRLAKQKQDAAVAEAAKANAERQQDRQDFRDGTYLQKKVDAVQQGFDDAKAKGRETDRMVREGIAGGVQKFGEGVAAGRAKGKETDKAVREGIARIGEGVSDFFGNLGKNVGTLIGD